jgi:hypothetical protein
MPILFSGQKLNQNYLFTILTTFSFILFLFRSNMGGVLLFSLVLVLFVINFMKMPSNDE